MAITEITAKTLGKKKSGWRWDKKREIFVSFVVDTTFDGKRHVKRGFLTERSAQDYIDQLKVQDRLKQIGVVELVKYPAAKKLFEIHLSKYPADKSKNIPKRVFAKFLAMLPRGIKINELKRKDFKDYADLRISENVKPETAHREITEISAALNKAGDYFAELENWQVPKIYRPPIKDEGRNRIVSREEREKLINHLLRERESSESNQEYLARRRVGLIAYFAPLTGLRHGEISAIKKSNFNASAKSLKAERLKTKVKGIGWTVFEPLTKTQLWVLNEAEKLYPKSEYFFSEHGKTHNKNYSILKEACKKLSIPYGKNTPNGFIIHDMRHTFVTILEHGAVDSSTTRSFSGHTRDGMMKRYAHATPDSRARAMEIIEREAGASSTDRESEFREFYINARSGKMSFNEFAKAVESFSGYLAKTQEIDVQDVQDVIEDKSDLVQ